MIAKDVITPEGVNKKAFYNIVGMEGENGDMVNVKVFIGEFTKEDIEMSLNMQREILNELEEKLSFFN